MYISLPQDGAKPLLLAINTLFHTFPKLEDNLTLFMLLTDLMFYHERMVIKHHLVRSHLALKNHIAAAGTFTQLCCVYLSPSVNLFMVNLFKRWLTRPNFPFHIQECAATSIYATSENNYKLFCILFVPRSARICFSHTFSYDDSSY